MFVVKSWLNLVIPDKIDFVTVGLSYPLWKKFPLFFSSFVSQEMEGENPPGISQDRFSTIRILDCRYSTSQDSLQMISGIIQLILLAPGNRI